MGRLAGVSGQQAVRAFERIGYVLSRQRGSHAILIKPGSPHLVIAMHKAVAPYLLLSQIRRAGLTEEQFRQLLS